MIYVKAPLNANAVIEIGIRPDNTFTRCPKCGHETQIDLSDFIDAEGFDATNFDMMCEKCSRDYIRKLKAEVYDKA